MARFLDVLTARALRALRPQPTRRSYSSSRHAGMLRLEALEDRLLLTRAVIDPSNLAVTVDAGFASDTQTVGISGHIDFDFLPPAPSQITFDSSVDLTDT